MEENLQQNNSLPENAYRELKPGEEYKPIMLPARKPKEETLYSFLMGLLMAIHFSAAAASPGRTFGPWL